MPKHDNYVATFSKTGRGTYSDLVLSSQKKTRHPINKFIYFEKLMTILTMMVHGTWCGLPLPQSLRPSFLAWIRKGN